MKEYATIWVCEDCRMADANGGLEDGQETEREPWSHANAELDPTPGLRIEEHECGKERGEDIEAECGCEQETFSWSSCEGCGSELGGSRYPYTVSWDREEKPAPYEPEPLPLLAPQFAHGCTVVDDQGPSVEPFRVMVWTVYHRSSRWELWARYDNQATAERIAEQMTISGNPNLKYFGVKRIQFPLA